MEPTFHLEGVIKTKEEMQDFEGPLNLILMLLSKNKIEIRDIQISEILDQYLEFIAKMQELDLEVASEFVQMASNLLYIKTKTLLSGDEEVTELELLMTSLEQLKAKDTYAAIRAVTPDILSMSERGRMLCSTPGETLPKYGEYAYKHKPVELMGAYAMFTRGTREAEASPEATRIMPKKIAYPVTDKSRQLVDLLRERGAEHLSALYRMCGSRSELVATFISILELCSIGSIFVTHDGDEMLVTFTGGDTDSILSSLTMNKEDGDGKE
jgi:segregation and condensation protein A